MKRWIHQGRWTTTLGGTSTLACCLACLPVISVPGEGLPEPSTVLYGQVINRSGSQPYIMTKGALSWAIRPAGEPGGFLFLATSLSPMGSGSGQLSYRLELPHSARVPGPATVDPGTLALGLDGETWEHAEIRVNGWSARIVSARPSGIVLQQANRAATHRLDLEVFFKLPDRDGDGLPDWWEERYNAGNALGDADGDGANNLQEYEAGTDPNGDNTIPRFLTTTVTVHENSTVGLPLQVADSDSRPDQLRYTLGALSEGLRVIRFQDGVEQSLQTGDTFTQDGVNHGMLRVRHTMSRQTDDLTIHLSVRDENPQHGTHSMAIPVRVFSAAEIGTPAALWLDAAQPQPSDPRQRDPGRWFDRSEQERHGTWREGSGPTVFQPNETATLAVPLFSDHFLALAQGMEARLAPGEAVTVLAAFRSGSSDSPQPAGPQQLLGDGRVGLRLGPFAADSPGRRLEFRSGNRLVQTVGPVPPTWAVVAAWREGERAAIEMNGRSAGGSTVPVEEATQPVRAGVGARSVGSFDLGEEQWTFAEKDPFRGAVGEVLVFPSALSAHERQRLGYSLMGKWAGYLFWDGSSQSRPLRLAMPTSGLSRSDYTRTYVPAHGRDRSYILLGSPGPDVLEGGMEADILQGGLGNDRLTGHGGADAFVFADASGATNRIEDFRPDEGDVIDLSNLLAGSSMDLDDYIEVRQQGTATIFAVNQNGGTRGYTNLVIEFPNRVWTQADLQQLWADGNLNTGGLRILPHAEAGPVRVSLSVVGDPASEEGSRPAEFVLRRTGLADAPLSVTVHLGGAAANGEDYSYVPSTLTFLAGSRELRVSIRPLSDGQVEPAEVAEMTVLPGEGYLPGEPVTANLMIEDLPMIVSIRAADPVAERQSQVPGHLVVRRTGVLSQYTLVRLDFGGSAVPGRDYETLSHFVELVAGQAEALLTIRPLPGAAANVPVVAQVVVVVDPQSSYRVADLKSAEVQIVDGRWSLPQWRARWFPTSPGDLSAFAQDDADADGVNNLHEFAFGFDPTRADSSEAGQRLPHVRLREGHFEVIMRPSPTAAGLEYEVALSDDLRVWRSGANHVERIDEPADSSGYPTVLFRDRQTPHREFQFLKVSITAQP